MIRKYIDIDVRETVNIGVDITFKDIIRIIQQCTDEEKDEILYELKSGGVIPDMHGRNRVGLFEQMKWDFFKENFNKISIEQLKRIV